MNIVLNAVDAMAGSGELGLATSLAGDGRAVVIRISDTGKGIPPDVMPLIFEPFFTTKKVGEGTGLGLAIVHGIVTRAGGRITVESTGAGTTFIIELSVAEEEGDPTAAEPTGDGAAEPQLGLPRTLA